MEDKNKNTSENKPKIFNQEHPLFAKADEKIKELNKNEHVVKGKEFFQEKILGKKIDPTQNVQANEQNLNQAQNVQANEQNINQAQNVQTNEQNLNQAQNVQTNEQNLNQAQNVQATEQNINQAQDVQTNGQQFAQNQQGQFHGQQFNQNQQGQFHGQQFNQNQQGQFNGHIPPFPVNQNPIAKFFSNTRNIIIVVAGILVAALIFYFTTGSSSKPEDTVKNTFAAMKEGDFNEVLDNVHFESEAEKERAKREIEENKEQLKLVKAGSSLIEVKILETEYITKDLAEVRAQIITPFTTNSTSTITLVKIKGKWKFDGRRSLARLI